LTNRHLIGRGHKKDLTNSFAHCIIGAGYTKYNFVTALLGAPAPILKKDYDFLHEFGHKFSAKMCNRMLTSHWRGGAENFCQALPSESKIFSAFHVEH
jgi:hypothetical protein